MPFKFYIDNQLVNEPDNSSDLIETIAYNKDLEGITVTQDVELKYSADNDLDPGITSGYGYIKSLFDSGSCLEADLVIIDNWASDENHLLYKGVIKIPQVFVLEDEFQLSAKVQDNSFYSYIHNNRDLKINLQSVKTKNAETITPISQYSIDMFNGATGAYGSSGGRLYHGFKATDILLFIVSFITDNKVSFQSDYLDNLDNQIFITKGQDLLNPYTLFPAAETPQYELSFQEMFNELNKQKNLAFYFDNSDPNLPILRIEDQESIYGAAVVYTFSDIDKIKTSINTRNLYGTVAAGSQITASGSTPNIYTWEEATSHFGWKEERYFPLGQCNTNEELDLVNEFVVSNNVIMETVVGASTGYLDEYFMIECSRVDTVALTCAATQFDFFGQPTPPVFYNMGLNNYSKLQRHSTKFEQAFGTFLGAGGGTFKALHGDSPIDDTAYFTVPQGLANSIPIGGVSDNATYPNETTLGGFDDGNNWNNVTSEYVIPQSGDYSFHAYTKVDVKGLIGTFFGFLDTLHISVSITLFDAGMNVKASGQMGSGSYSGATSNGLHVFNGTWLCNGVAGDIVKTGYFISYQPNQSGNQTQPRQIYFTYESYLECNGAPDTGISITTGNETLRRYIHEFKYDISETDWRTIKARPTGLFAFEKDGETRYGWILEMKHNNWTGRTNIKLLTAGE